jgi:alpha,alpha-trehalose phosphorylase
MIEHSAFLCEPWKVTESQLQLELLAQTESIFALSNGHIGLRGNLDEGDPYGLPGTYLNSFCELRPFPSAETAYGQPESRETVVNVTNGKLIRLLVDDEPFDVRYGRLLQHRRVLDMREGTLRREVEWESPSKHTIALRTARVVSLSQRSVAAISYEVEALSGDVRLVIQSVLMANEELPAPTQPSRASSDLPDPRGPAYLEDPLISVGHRHEAQLVLLVHRTKVSGLRMAAVMDHHVLDLPEDHEVETQSSPDVGRVTLIVGLQRGERVRFVKYLAYGWSSSRSIPALEDQAVGAAYAARHTGFEGLLAEQRKYLDGFWEGADIEVEGDDRVRQAVHFGLLHILQASGRAELRPIPAKGLTGPGYDGHAFWDTEAFVLPVLTATAPEAAADVIRWRHGTLPLARARARELGRKGAAFPWRTILGDECSGYWPASTAAVHVNADIAEAAVRYVDATGDESLAQDVVTEILVETARLWQSLGHYDDGRGFRIDGVTGPDEYSALADNNVYTNLMAQANLRRAAEFVERYPGPSAALGANAEEVAAWREAADQMVVPYDEELRVHQQAEGFTHYQLWDFEATRDQYPLMLHFSYFDLHRSQVVKQADLVMALYERGEAFTAEERTVTFATTRP